MDFYTGFLAGLMFGAPIGVAVMCLLIMAKDSQED